MIPGYNTCQPKTENRFMDSVAIAVKCALAHRFEDDFLSETLAVTIDTTDEPITLATS